MNAQVAIVGGGGGVGASLAFNLLLRDEPYEVVLVDGRSGMAHSHEMDLQQVLAAGATGSVRIVELGEVAEADVVVVTASTPLTVNRSRMVYLRDNAAILTEVRGALPRGWPGVALVVTNPVDPLCTWLQRHTGLDRRRVLGYTANDSLRLRTAVGNQLGVRSGAVDAWVLGEHGEGCLPLLDRVLVSGEPVELSPEQRQAAEQFVRGWYERHVALDSGRSSTWTSGHGLARMVAALSGTGEALWPASVVLEGEYGIHGAALSVPVTLAQGGAREIHEWDLSPEQLTALRAAAEGVRRAADALNINGGR
ncbi:MAG: malate dehydrogenase [Actinomycetota bacterium]|nr:malate dehydrogenase [Actinomycetota bacterium]